MGFFSTDRRSRGNEPSPELLHKLECRACPLNKLTCNKHPHMEPTGSDKPLIYMLGEGPGKTEDDEGEQFIGPSGELIRARIPKRLVKHIRWNNVVRTRPVEFVDGKPKNRKPTNIEIEACRPSIIKDIEDTKPVAIFGFGGIPLKWASGIWTKITDWRGRRFPVRIGSHVCWFYPMLHPSYLLRQRKEWARKKGPTAIGSEPERAFVFDLKRAFREVEEGLPEAVVHDRSIVEYGVEIYPGGPGQLDKVKKLLSWAGKLKESGVDYETDCLRPYGRFDWDEQEWHKAKILTAAVGTRDVSFGFALDHPQNGWTHSERKTLRKLWRKFLLSPCLKAVHQLPFEHEWSGYKFGRDVLRSNPWGCSLTQASVLDERKGSGGGKKKEAGPLSLGFLTYQYFGVNIKLLNPISRRSLAREPIEKVLRYNVPDAKYHLLLFQAQRKRLKAEGLIGPYKRGLRRVPTCVLAQLEGMPIDEAETKRLLHKYRKAERKAQKQITKLDEVAEFKRRFKHDFNPESPDDVVSMLRKIMKRKEGLQDTGKYSTDKKVLARIDHPISNLILAVRKANKKISTYCYTNTEDKTLVWPDGKVHAVFNHGPRTRTFRLSSEDPNLQNVPKREEGNKEVRRQLVAPPGYYIALIDYGQIEHRVIAMASKDKATVEALWNRYDVHGTWAKKLARAYPPRIGGKQFLDDPKVMDALRTDTKNQWTFPLFFGAQLSSVAGYLNIPEEEIEDEFEEFKEEFEGVFEWQKTIRDFYYEHGYVENLLKRRRYAPIDYNSMINTPIQGTAAELVMEAMSRLSEKAEAKEDWHFQPKVQVHDELQFLLPAKRLDYYIEPIVKEMLTFKHDFINVPITVELSLGPNLLDMTKQVTVSSDGQWDWHKDAWI